MNIDKINAGMVLSYKEMCVLLEEPQKDGASKKAQMKEWARYFVYTKKGVKYTIEKLYDSPMPKALRAGHGDLERYSLTLLSYLADKVDETEEVSEVFINKADIYEVCGFFGKEYYAFRNRLHSELDKSIAEYPGIPLKEINFWYKLTSTEFKDLRKGLLQSLVSRKIITLVTTRRFYDSEKKVSRLATFTENVKINEIEFNCLAKLGLNNKFQVYTKGVQKDFYEERNRLIAENLGFTNVQEGFRIGFTNNIADKIAMYKQEKGIVSIDRQKTNEFVRKKIKLSGAKVARKAKSAKPSKLGKFSADLLLEDGSDYLSFLVKDKFTDNFNKLTDELLSLDL